MRNIIHFGIALAIAASVAADDGVAVGRTFIGWGGPGVTTFRHQVMLVAVPDFNMDTNADLAVIVDDRDRTLFDAPILSHVEVSVPGQPTQRNELSPIWRHPSSPRWATFHVPSIGDAVFSVRLFASGGLSPRPTPPHEVTALSRALRLAQALGLDPVTADDASLRREPTEATVLRHGSTYSIAGHLTVQSLEGPRAFLTDLEGRYEVPNMFLDPPTVAVDRIALSSASGIDLVALARLVGPSVRVEATGAWRFSPRAMHSALAVTEVRIRGIMVPPDMPTVEKRLIALAERSAREALGPDGSRARRTGACLTPELVVHVTLAIDRTLVAFAYDSLTGVVERLPLVP